VKEPDTDRQNTTGQKLSDTDKNRNRNKKLEQKQETDNYIVIYMQ